MPSQIEGVIQSHPAVLEVAVVSMPHPIDSEQPIAFVSKIPNKEVIRTGQLVRGGRC